MAFNKAWFTATKVGEYPIYCAEYCGTEHSKMIGQVIVMERDEFQRWLGGEIAGQPVQVDAKLSRDQGFVPLARQARD